MPFFFDGANTGMVMALVGQASTQARQRVQSAVVSSPNSGWRRLMSNSHTSAHLLHDAPLAVSRHFSSLITGTKVREKRPTRFMRADSGQKRVHHFRKNTSSTMSMAGMRMMPMVASPAEKARHSTSTVAKVRPTGHTRQNTGKPNTAVDRSAPPSTAWRESSLPCLTGWHFPQAPQAWPLVPLASLAGFRLSSSCWEMALISAFFCSARALRFLGERK